MNKRNTIHGMHGTRAYISWKGMKYRCLNKNSDKYKIYGGRGITICARWMKFIEFYKDMGDRPAKTTLDRIDNDGNYEPGNCRWADASYQANNKRTNVILEFEGKSMTIAQWARVIGIGISTLKHRVRHGWSVADALTKPVDKRYSTKGRAVL